MENIGIPAIKEEAEEKMEELVKLNKSGKFEVIRYDVIGVTVIKGSIPGEELALPEGYEYDKMLGINNDCSTGTGVFIHFEYSYDPERYAPKVKKKKSWLQRLLKFFR